MKKCDMPYAMSIFLPECGYQHELLNKQELIEVLALKSDDVIASAADSTPLLIDLVQRIKHNRSINAGSTSASSQTEDFDVASLTIDQKL